MLGGSSKRFHPRRDSVGGDPDAAPLGDAIPRVRRHQDGCTGTATESAGEPSADAILARASQVNQ